MSTQDDIIKFTLHYELEDPSFIRAIRKRIREREKAKAARKAAREAAPHA